MLSRFKLNISGYQVLKNWFLLVCRFLTTFFSIFVDISCLTAVKRLSTDSQLTWRACNRIVPPIEPVFSLFENPSALMAASTG